MARRPVSKPASRKPAAKRPAKASKGAGRAAALSQETRNWIASNFDVRNAVILIIIVLGVLTVAPNVQTYFSYRQQIADMKTQVEEAKKNLADMAVERKRWDDPVYVRSQARQRLYSVLPGEVSYLVMDAGSVNTSDKSGTVGAMLAERRNTAVISSSIRTTSENWVDDIVGSVIRAGIEEPVVEEPTPKETKAPNN